MGISELASFGEKSLLSQSSFFSGDFFCVFMAQFSGFSRFSALF